ncbi:MAG: TIGR03915 family putative DNA repair protein [Candidatus Eremiobacteraeota bacterium]|nr:TIGR03915 family putative DNA repair protein [Candidatus Eremiobacteraeota bacterium]
MAIYLYDGSFPGLLTALELSFSGGPLPEAITKEAALQLDLFSTPQEIATDERLARKMAARIREAISPCAFRNILYAYLSEERGMEMKILSYLGKGWQWGSALDSAHHDEEVKTLHMMVNRVKLESHRMKGFLRFQRAGGALLYAPIEPDHFILPLVAPHFAKRFSRGEWAIHDRRRQKAALCRDSRWEIVEVLEESIPAADKEEKAIKALWKTFFESLAIETRENPRLQRRMMPGRYWKYLPECGASTTSKNRKG